MAYLVFISWSGKRSGLIANAFSSFIDQLFDDAIKNKVFLSSRDIRTGTDWIKEINGALRESKVGIICLTPENMTEPWLLFEAGALSKTAGETFVIPYLHEMARSKLGRPLEQFNAAKTTRDDTNKIVKVINSVLGSKKLPDKILQLSFDDAWPKFQGQLEKLPTVDSEIHLSLSLLQEEFPQVVGSVVQSRQFKNNPYFAQIISEALHRTVRNLEKTESHFEVPLSHYPLYLVSLLEKFQNNLTVNAVAIVDSTERFWPLREGEKILKATPHGCNRIFVFREREHLKANLAWLSHHAKKYIVYVASYKRLATVGEDYLKDFSLVGDSSTSLLAYYPESSKSPEESLPAKTVRFSTESREITEHQSAFANMLRLATRVTATESNYDNRGERSRNSQETNPEDEESVERLVDAVFEPLSKSFQKKPVEMSSYIDILEYDLHEEEHAYYCEMMKCMLKVSKLQNGSRQSQLRTLEFGSGTGLFTKRLAKIKKINIVAVELDWACYHFLRLKMEALRFEMDKNGTKLTAENKDCTIYNPPGKFDCVFSSFADHHISSSDKGRYFQNVKKNLNPKGLYIVGDEFLPEHNDKSLEDWKRALKAYHHHIIECAEASNHPSLVKLEMAALESGLQNIGDYKLSCSQYEALAQKSGLRQIHKQKIGPLDREDCGGIYVYAFSL